MANPHIDSNAPQGGFSNIKRGKVVPQVTGVTATTLNSYQIKISWNNISKAGFYRVYRDSSFLTTVPGGWATSPYFTDSGLTPNTTYTYTVSCVINNVEGPLSSPSSATTQTSVVYPYKNVLLLNFDGGLVTSPRFGYINQPVASSGFTAEEIQFVFDTVQAVWAEDHPNIVVTMDKTIYDQADPFARQQTYITSTNLYQAGGVTFFGSFSFGDDTPNFVFSQLLYYYTAYAIQSIIHEQGHAFGLHHAINVCGETYANSVISPNGERTCQFMGSSYSNPYDLIVRYFQTPEKCAFYGTPDMQQDCSVGVDEDAIIESKLK